MRLVDGDDVDGLATGELGLGAARESARLVAEGAITTGRVQTGDDNAWMRVLVGLIPGLDLVGYKEFHRVGKRVRYHVSLFRHSDGDALGIVDGRRITSLRTASTAALAFDHVFGGAAIRLGVIGSGEEAREGLRAAAGVVELREVRVFSPSAAHRTAYAEQLGAELSVPVAPVGDVADALAQADAAYVATAARAPVVTAGHVRHLRFVAAVGATPPRPSRAGRRCDRRGRRGGRRLHRRSARAGRHDRRRPSRLGLGHGGIAGRLAAAPVPADNGRPILFKSIGSVEQDLVLARHLLAAAEAQGRGREVDEVGTLRMMR